MSMSMPSSLLNTEDSEKRVGERLTAGPGGGMQNPLGSAVALKTHASFRDQ